LSVENKTLFDLSNPCLDYTERKPLVKLNFSARTSGWAPEETEKKIDKKLEKVSNNPESQIKKDGVISL